MGVHMALAGCARRIVLWPGRLLCNSCLVMTRFLIGDSDILPCKELHGSLQVSGLG